MVKNFVCLAIILFINGRSEAQPAASDTSSGAILHPVAVYYQTLGEQSPLYNGREYVDYAGTIHVGHPFYSTTEFTNGTIYFDGMVFENVMLLYDIIKDKVLIRHYNTVFRIDMPVKKINEFTLLNHTFVRLLPDSARVIEEGFYDKLYQGKNTLFVKRKKLIREERAGNDLSNVVDEKNIFYILKQGIYYPVKNLRGLLNILSGRREQIQQYLKKNGIKFRKDREKAILMAVEYYDRLSN